MSKSKTKTVPARVPEGESIDDQEELSMEELNNEFKKRMWEYRSFVKFILNDLELRDNSRVLEIGPGPAWISIIMVKENPTLHVTGFEVSEDMIRIAKKNVIDENLEEKLSFIQGNAKNMSLFNDGSFDAVITHDSLHHWEEPIQIFNEIARVLKDDGVLCIGDGRRDLSMGAKVIFKIIKMFISKKMRYYWKTSIDASYTPDEVKNLLDQSELKNRYEIKSNLFDITICNKI